MHIDLKKQNYKSNSKWLIRNGEPVNGFVLPEEPITLDILETLYRDYKFSYPNPKLRKLYFKALPASELSTDQMITGKTRNQAKNELEKTVLFAVLKGDLIWPNDKMWFWQPLQDKDFVLLKEWFTPKEV